MNGWTNRETWLINLWFAYDNQEELDDIKAMVDEEIGNLQEGLPGYLTDLLGTSFIMDEINWDELAGHLNSMEGLANE